MPLGKALKHLKSSSGAPGVLLWRRWNWSTIRAVKKKCRRFETVQRERSVSTQFGKTALQFEFLYFCELFKHKPKTNSHDQTCRRVEPPGRSHCKHVAFNDFPAGLTPTTVTGCDLSLLRTEYLMLIQHASVMLDLWTQSYVRMATGTVFARCDDSSCSSWLLRCYKGSTFILKCSSEANRRLQQSESYKSSEYLAVSRSLLVCI